MKRLKCLYLDLLSIRGLFMSKEENAKFHLKSICPKCPKWRREMRNLKGDGCYWINEWNKKNYNIPRSFGFKNWLSQYVFLKVNKNNLRV
jgi:hypothetical protein